MALKNEKEASSKELIRKLDEVSKLYIAADDAVILKRNMNNKLKFADEDIKAFYNTVKNELMSYKGVKSRMSNVSENFRKKRELIAKITLAGANLKLYLALPVDGYPANIYHQKNLGNMDLYAFVPFMVKIKTPLAARKACFLISEAMKIFGMQKNRAYVDVDYAAKLVPEENEALAKSRSVQTVRESELLNADAASDFADYDEEDGGYENAEKPLIRKAGVKKLYVADDDAVILKRNMKNKLKFADDDIKAFYTTVKNELMSYKVVKSRMSNVSENFRKKRVLLAKITLAGANLKLYLALPVDGYPANIYHQKNLGNMDLYAFVPFMVKIKTPLAARKACFLVSEVMRLNGLAKNPKYVEQDYISQMVPDENEILAKSRSVITVRESEIAGGRASEIAQAETAPEYSTEFDAEDSAERAAACDTDEAAPNSETENLHSEKREEARAEIPTEEEQIVETVKPASENLVVKLTKDGYVAKESVFSKIVGFFKSLFKKK